VTASLRWRPYGRDAILFELDSTDEIHALHRAALRHPSVRESVPGASTLLVSAPDLSATELISALTSEADKHATSRDAPTTHVVDVTYDGADLHDVATLTGRPVEEVIARHAAPTYVVAFLGFSRGFPYLGGLDPAILVPRLATPRTSVPGGSVAMGAGYTGIYPASSPGGWRVLGRTSAQFFDEHADPPSRLVPGDLVQFRAV
jgi:KipI family sensor histidine kinase inhibitor